MLLPENLAQATLPLGNWYDIFGYWELWVAVGLLAVAIALWRFWPKDKTKGWMLFTAYNSYYVEGLTEPPKIEGETARVEFKKR